MNRLSAWTIMWYAPCKCMTNAFSPPLVPGVPRTAMYFTVDPSEASLIAGGFGGMAGACASYPLDTLKTKVQLHSYYSSAEPTRDINPLSLAKDICELEGISGFFAGVETTMLGQAFIKSLAFATYTFVTHRLQSLGLESDAITTVMAACCAGFVVSFLVAPIGTSYFS